MRPRRARPARHPYLDAAVGVFILVLTSLLLTNVGVLVALRASSALNAQRTLGLGGLGIVVVLTTGISALPEGARTDLQRLADDAGSLPPAVLVALVLAAFVLVNVALVALSLKRFQRPKLIRP